MVERSGIESSRALISSQNIIRALSFFKIYLLLFDWRNATRELVGSSYLRTKAWCSATWTSAGTTDRCVNRVQVQTHTSFLSFMQSLTSYTQTLVVFALAGGMMAPNSAITFGCSGLIGSAVPLYQSSVWASTDEQIWKLLTVTIDLDFFCLSALYNIDQ